MKNLILLIPLLGLMVGCVDDWGQKDPIPGVEKNAIFGKVATYNFGNDLFGAQLDTVGLSVGKLTYNVGNLDGDSYALVLEEDSVEYGLHIKSSFIEFKNPYASTVAGLASGFGLTFWVKQETDEKAASLIQFYDVQGETSCVEFTSDGVLSYNGSQLGSSSSPLSPSNMWHYVALQVLTTGYSVTVDGVKVVDEPGDEDIYADLIYYVANCAKCCILYNTQATWFSQLNFYRNEMSESQTDRPASMVAGADEEQLVHFGAEDFTNGFWTTFSDYFTITGNTTAHFGFYNYSDGNANWDNWILVVTTPYERDAAGYSEYLVLRADNYGWGNSYDGTTLTMDWSDWTSWEADMKDAYVDLTVTRNGSTISIVAVTTGASGTVYNYTASITADFPDAVNLFLTGEACYIGFRPSQVWIGQEYKSGSYIVGSTDCDNAFWPNDEDDDPSYSEYYTIPANPDYPLVFSFYNWSDHINPDSGVTETYYFWDAVVTNAYKRSERGSGYSEYFVVRSDAYGWDGNVVPLDESGFTSSFDTKTYAADMNGSYHDVGFVRNGANFIIRDIGVKSDGATKFPYYSYEGTVSATEDVNVFFTNEHGYMDIVRVAYMPYFNKYEW